MASEYGYTDEVLLRIPLRRLRQMLAAIRDRQHYQHIQQWELAKWQTKSICQFVSLTVETTGGKNPLFDAACKLGDPTDSAAGDEVDSDTQAYFESLEDEPQTDSQGETVLDPIGMNVAMYLDTMTGGPPDA